MSADIVVISVWPKIDEAKLHWETRQLALPHSLIKYRVNNGRVAEMPKIQIENTGT